MDWYTSPDTALESATDATLSVLTDGTPTTIDTTSLTWYASTDFQTGLMTDAQASALGDGRALISAPIHVIFVTATANGKQTPADPIKITVVEVHT